MEKGDDAYYLLESKNSQWLIWLTRPQSDSLDCSDIKLCRMSVGEGRSGSLAGAYTKGRAEVIGCKSVSLELLLVLVGAVSPVNHKGLHQSWTKTSLYPQVIHFTSHHTTRQAFFGACLYSAGARHRNLHSAGWPILFCGPTQEPCVSHSQHRRNREMFCKKAGEWTGRVEISKEEIPGIKCSMYGYILTYSRLQRDNV